MRYASNYPGSRGFEDDMKLKLDNEKKNKNTEDDVESPRPKSVAEKLRNSEHVSPFGLVIDKGRTAGHAVEHNTADTIAQIAYAGMLKDDAVFFFDYLNKKSLAANITI